MWTGIDRRLVVVPLATGVYGIVIAAAVHHFGDMRSSVFLSVLAAPGAALAGLVVSSLFGRQGQEGWVEAYVAAFVATMLGAGVSGLAFGLVLGLSGLALGLVPVAIIFVFYAIIIHPPVAAIWLVGATLIHLAALEAAEDIPHWTDFNV